MTFHTAAKIDYRTIRRLLARMLKVPEAMNVKSEGLYAYRYDSYIMVRLYKNIQGVHTKVFEAKVPLFEFPNEHMVAQLMLLA